MAFLTFSCLSGNEFTRCLVFGTVGLRTSRWHCNRGGGVNSGTADKTPSLTKLPRFRTSSGDAVLKCPSTLLDPNLHFVTVTTQAWVRQVCVSNLEVTEWRRPCLLHAMYSCPNSCNVTAHVARPHHGGPGSQFGEYARILSANRVSSEKKRTRQNLRTRNN